MRVLEGVEGFEGFLLLWNRGLFEATISRRLSGIKRVFQHSLASLLGAGPGHVFSRQMNTYTYDTPEQTSHRRNGDTGLGLNVRSM